MVRRGMKPVVLLVVCAKKGKTRNNFSNTLRHCMSTEVVSLDVGEKTEREEKRRGEERRGEKKK